MIENAIFEQVQRTSLVPGLMTENEYVEAIEDLVDDVIDGSNIKRGRIFATQLYRYCLRSGKMNTPLLANEFGDILGVCV